MALAIRRRGAERSNLSKRTSIRASESGSLWLGQRRLQFTFGLDLATPAPTEDLRQPMILPHLEIVVRAVIKDAFDLVAIIVDQKDNRIEPVPDERGDFLAGHLEGAVAHKDEGPVVRGGQLGAQRRRHGVAEREVERLA